VRQGIGRPAHVTFKVWFLGGPGGSCLLWNSATLVDSDGGGCRTRLRFDPHGLLSARPSPGCLGTWDRYAESDRGACLILARVTGTLCTSTMTCQATCVLRAVVLLPAQRKVKSHGHSRVHPRPVLVHTLASSKFSRDNALPPLRQPSYLNGTSPRSQQYFLLGSRRDSS